MMFCNYLSACGSSLPKMIFNMTVLMADKAGDSVVTVSFL